MIFPHASKRLQSKSKNTRMLQETNSGSAHLYLNIGSYTWTTVILTLFQKQKESQNACIHVLMYGYGVVQKSCLIFTVMETVR